MEINFKININSRKRIKQGRRGITDRVTSFRTKVCLDIILIGSKTKRKSVLSSKTDTFCEAVIPLTTRGCPTHFLRQLILG